MHHNHSVATILYKNSVLPLQRLITTEYQTVAKPQGRTSDRQGNVIGEPITGSIDTQSQIDDLNKKIDKIMEKELQ